MSDPEYATIRCRTCGGVAHPATGCVYSTTFVVCGPCTRDAWRWIMGFINGKGARRGVRFYDHVNQINGILIERTRNMSNENQADTKSFHVEIRRSKDGHVEKRMGPMSRDRAEKVARGASINMSDDYHAVVVGPDDAETT